MKRSVSGGQAVSMAWRCGGVASCHDASRTGGGSGQLLTVEEPAERGKRERASFSEGAEEDWNGEGKRADG